MAERFPITGYPDSEGSSETPVSYGVDIEGPGNKVMGIVTSRDKGRIIVLSYDPRSGSGLRDVHLFFDRHFYARKWFWYESFFCRDLVMERDAGIGDGSNRVFTCYVSNRSESTYASRVIVAGSEVSGSTYTLSYSATLPYPTVITFNVGSAPANRAVVRLRSTGSAIYKVMFAAEPEPINFTDTKVYKIAYKMRVVA